MSLSKYHKQYMAQSDAEIAKKAEMKEKELRVVFKKLKLGTRGSGVRVAVLGCGDRRLVAHHRQIFEKVLKRDIELITFDVTIEHLKGEEGVVRHNCTRKLPGGPYDIVYGHVFLKFLPISKQWKVIKNSYDVLTRGGLAIYVFDEEDYASDNVPLEKWKEKMKDEKIKFLELSFRLKVKTKFLKGKVIILKR